MKHWSDMLDCKRLSDVLVHKRLRGQIYIRLLSEKRTSVCCPKLFAVFDMYLKTNGEVILPCESGQTEYTSKKR